MGGECDEEEGSQEPFQARFLHVINLTDKLGKNKVDISGLLHTQFNPIIYGSTVAVKRN